MRYLVDAARDPLTLSRAQLRQVVRGDVDHRALVVYLVLQALAREDRDASVTALVVATRMARPLVEEALAVLQRTGWVTTEGSVPRLPCILPMSQNDRARALAGPADSVEQERVASSGVAVQDPSTGSAHATQRPAAPAEQDMHPGPCLRPQGSGGGSDSEYEFPREKSTEFLRGPVSGPACGIPATEGRSNVGTCDSERDSADVPAVAPAKRKRRAASAAVNSSKQAALWTGADLQDQGPVDEDGRPIYLTDLARQLLATYPHGKTNGGAWRKPGLTEVVRRLRPAFHGKKEAARSALILQVVRGCERFRALEEAERREREDAIRFTPGLDVWIGRRGWEATTDADAPKRAVASADERVARTKDYLAKERGGVSAAPVDQAAAEAAAARWRQRMQGGDGGEEG